MADDIIHDRGRGPELVGTRIAVQDLFPDFVDPTATEAYRPVATFSHRSTPRRIRYMIVEGRAG
jgi:hypothetical protein